MTTMRTDHAVAAEIASATRTATAPATRRNPNRGSTIRLTVIVLLLGLAFALALTACGSEDAAEESVADAADSSEGFDQDEAAEEDFEVAVEGEAGDDVAADGSNAVPASATGDVVDTDADGEAGPVGAGAPAVVPTAADLGRKLIFTAVLSVGVDDVNTAGAEATAIIEDVGGFVFGQETTGGAEARSEITFKVLPSNFDEALDRLGAVGELRNQSVSTDDVTERVVDLESRIEVAQLGVERLRAALANAASLEDYAEIERLLLERESDLEVMRGQLRTLQDRIDLATITLILTQERVDNDVALSVSHYEGFDEGRGCPAPETYSVEQGKATTICFEVVNNGDQTLRDVALTESSLDIDEPSDLISVYGDMAELAAGQSALLAVEVEPERDLNLRLRLTATPVDEAGNASGPSVTRQDRYQVPVFAAAESPGFTDGFSSGVSVLGGIWTAVKVILGFALPMLVIGIPIALALWAFRRARPGKSKTSRPVGQIEVESAPNLPPPPPSAD